MKYLLLTLFLLSGCSSMLFTPPVQQGRPVDQQAVNQLKIGMDASKVLATVGEPDYRNFFHKNQWYYIEEHPKNRFHYDVNGVKLTFDQDRLSKIEPFSSNR
ncbi:MAG: hypothetical protein CMF42_03015 [Legionellales bacterium]|nr:hypothetical protein [Legionellales bacterium]OUX67742.1 MAG: hypothetical protein CBD38_01880 [bacterium TMED178]